MKQKIDVICVLKGFSNTSPNDDIITPLVTDGRTEILTARLMLLNPFISIFPPEIKAEKILAIRSNVSEGRIFHISPLQFILNRSN